MSQQGQQEPFNVLDIDGVCAKTTLSPSTIYDKVAKGEFPLSMKISPGRSVWIESEVTLWLLKHKERHDAELAAKEEKRKRAAKRRARAA